MTTGQRVHLHHGANAKRDNAVDTVRPHANRRDKMHFASQESNVTIIFKIINTAIDAMVLPFMEGTAELNTDHDDMVERMRFIESLRAAK